MNEYLTLPEFPGYKIYKTGVIVGKYGRPLKPFTTNNGYLRVNLHTSSGNRKMTVHRLVALAFIANSNNKPEVDHINKNRKDNRADNLRWVTRKENCIGLRRESIRLNTIKEVFRLIDLGLTEDEIIAIHRFTLDNLVYF